ncbi:MAG: hypothetical protein ACT4TC_01480 [Myxococcaceae bacterium]
MLFPRERMGTARPASVVAPLAACAAAVLLGACLFFLPFSPEGAPCDSEKRCQEGYGCKSEDGLPICRKAIAPNTFQCGGCSKGLRCPLTQTGACVADTCQSRRCPAGEACQDNDAGASCILVRPPALGHVCSRDTDCTSQINKDGGTEVRVCYRSTIQVDATGQYGPGICVEPCGTPGANCSTPGVICDELKLGLNGGTARLCLPPAQRSTCTTNAQCAADGLVCGLFDHAQIGPALLCTAPLPQAAKVGGACSVLPFDGGIRDLCGNGLCVPRTSVPNQQPERQLCGEPCDATTCPSGKTCTLVELGAVEGVIRHVPLCVTAATFCTSCSTSAVCAADAPTCANYDGRNCLSSCTPDAGTSPSCPAGQVCSLIEGTFRCVPNAGACP